MIHPVRPDSSLAILHVLRDDTNCVRHGHCGEAFGQAGTRSEVDILADVPHHVIAVALQPDECALVGLPDGVALAEHSVPTCQGRLSTRRRDA